MGKALNEKSSLGFITGNILRNFDISFKLSLKHQYLSGVSLIGVCENDKFQSIDGKFVINVIYHRIH